MEKKQECKMRPLPSVPGLATCGIILFALGPASAQQLQDVYRHSTANMNGPQPATTTSDKPASGPAIYLADTTERLSIFYPSTKTLKIIGSTGVALTDLAFQPGK